ncbi:MAG: diguanylate cyclase [Pseudomonadota bacterium]
MWLLLLCFSVVPLAGAAEVISGTDDYRLKLRYALADPQQNLLPGLQAETVDLRAVPEQANFGFSPAAHWFAGRLTNVDHPQSDWILMLEYPLLDHVDVYVDLDAATPLHLTSGDRESFSRRLRDHRFFSFPVRLEAGQSLRFALRVESDSSIQVPVRLMTADHLADDNFRSQFGMGLLYGTFAALILYNLLLFMSLGDRTFLYYVLYATSFGLLQFSLNGLSFQFLWPDDPTVANLSVVLLLPLAQIAMLQFCRSFLSLRTSAPTLDHMALALMLLLSIVSFAAFVLPYALVIRAGTFFVFLSASLVIVGGVRAWSQGFESARYFVLAWALLILGMIAYAMVSFGVLPKSFLTTYGMQIGTALEMILLSFALAHRIRLLQEQNRRIEADARTEMEARVDERTAALNDALTRLETANRVLEESSQRDGLTGVHNRRFLDLSLTRMWADAIDSGRPLALIVLDLDRFKEVNDQRGHLAGDDALRQVASTLVEALKDQDCVLARFGGEEFFVLLPRLAGGDLEPLCQTLRSAIEALSISSEDQTFRVTASVGGATMRAGQGKTYRDLVRRADKAMYEAKRRGRNQVVIAGAESAVPASEP